MKKQSKIILIIFILSTALSIYSLFFSNAAKNRLIDANNIIPSEKYINLEEYNLTYESEYDVIDFEYINDYEMKFSWDARISENKPGDIIIYFCDNQIKEVPRDSMKELTKIPKGVKTVKINMKALGQYLIRGDVILYQYDDKEKIDTQIINVNIPGSVVNLSGSNYLKDFSFSYDILPEAKYYKIKILLKEQHTYMSVWLGYLEMEWD